MAIAHSMLFVVVAGSLALGCKRSPLLDTEACDRIAALPQSPWSAADRDKCYLTYNDVGPNVRRCTDDCVRSSRTALDYDDCRDDCTNAVYPTFLVCQKLNGSERHFDACMKKHEPLITEAGERYKCWSRCGRRAATAIDAEACDKTCNLPD